MFNSLFGRPQKASIASLLVFQAKNCLDNALSARDKHDIDQELKYCITTHLLLGIALEGVINDIGESHFDSWTWKKLEKNPTPLKWKLIADKKSFLDPSKEPLQTIDELYRLRNEIAHPKSKEQGQDIIIISNQGEIAIEPKDSFSLPDGDLTIYQGYKTLLKEFNGNNTLKRFKKVIQAILEIDKLFPDILPKWPKDIFSELEAISVTKNVFNKK